MTTDRALLMPNAMPQIPALCAADRFDNIIREWGVGFCCEYFHPDGFDSPFSHWFARQMLARDPATDPETAEKYAREMCPDHRF